MINILNEKNFKFMTKDGTKLVFFTAPWCGYCAKQKPVLEELSAHNYWIGEVNGDENPHLTTQYSIQAFPSFILFKDGNIISQFVGFHPKEELLKKFLSV
jgi:thioredoxin 1